MLPDYEMLCYEFNDNNDIVIFPVFDVHYGAAECMEDKFREFLKYVEETPNAYLILGGDLINNSIRTSLGDIFKETRSPSAQKKEMATLLKPVKNKILCSVTGNHERRSMKDVDDDPAYDIMCKLDIENKHRENVAFVKIQLGRKVTSGGYRNRGPYRPTYTLCVTHGSGGGIYTGTSVLRGERFAYTIDGLDVLIVGHSHKPFTTQPGKLVIDPRNNKVSVKPFKVVSATSWMEYAGYAAQKMYLPTSYCQETITLSATKKDIAVTMR